MKLFDVVGGLAVPLEHTLCIKAFKDIWDRDDDDKKSTACQHFAFVVLVADPRKTNPFHEYPKEIRPIKVAKYVYGEEELPDELVQEAIRVYEEIWEEHAPTLRFLRSAIALLDNMGELLGDLDLAEVDDNGKRVNNLSELMRVVKDFGPAKQSLNTLREEINKELETAGKSVGNREITGYERKPLIQS